MKKAIILFTIAMSTMLFATNTISVVEGTASNGTAQITVDFLLENADDVGGFQFKLSANPDVLVGTAVSANQANMTIAGSLQGDGSYMVLCYSMSGDSYPAEFNDVACSVTFDVSGTLEEESVLIGLADGIISDPLGNELADTDFVGGNFSFSGDAPAAIISVDPNTLTFTPTTFGESVTQTLTISNVGTLDLMIFDITSDDTLFTTDFTTMITLAPEASEDIEVTYLTPADSLGFGIMSILHIINNSDAADRQVSMQVLSVPDISVEPTILDFGTLEYGQTDTTLSFTITNTGTEDLKVKIEASGDDPATAFDWNPPMTGLTTMLMGESQTIDVSISADASAGNTYTGILEIWRSNLTGDADIELDETVSLSVVIGEPTGVKSSSVEIPSEFKLNQNYPNPFNPTTTISFDVAAHGLVKLAIYNLLGEKVATLSNEILPPGSYQSVWNGADESGELMPSGIYFYRMSTSRAILTQKMVLLK